MRFKNLRREPQEDNMHAMIDVVFLLLIYFLCTAQFGLLEFDVPADMSAGSAQQQISEDFEAVTIMILDQQRGFRCNGTLYAHITVLEDHLRSLRGVFDAHVIIDAEAQVAFQDVMQVMDCATALKYSKISFAGK